MTRRQIARTCTVAAATAALLLVGCGGDTSNAGNGGNGGTPTPGARLDFDVRVGSGIEAHVVIHAADGSVLEHQPVDVATRRVSFANVPDDALVTAFAKTVRTQWRDDGTDVPGSSYEATTYTASYVHGRSFWFGFGDSLWTTVSGPCPDGSDDGTRITVRVGTSSSSQLCRFDADTEEYRFDIWRSLWADQQQTDGRYSLIVFAREGWGEETHYALLLDQAPDALMEGLTITSDDWRDDFETNTLAFSFPALEDDEWGSATLNLSALHEGRNLVPHVSMGRSLGGAGASAGEATFLHAPVPAERFSAWQAYSFSRRVDGGWTWSNTSRFDDDVSLPLDTSLDVGTDLWPLLDDIAWVDGATPELTFAWSGPEPTSLDAYVETRRTDADEAFIQKRWRLRALPGAVGAAEALRFPNVPTELAVFVPRLDGVDSSYAQVRLFSYAALDADMPSTAHSVTGTLEVWESVDTGATAELGFGTARAVSDDQAPLQRGAESIITLR